jgi:hypothetical protein
MYIVPVYLVRNRFTNLVLTTTQYRIEAVSIVAELNGSDLIPAWEVQVVNG